MGIENIEFYEHGLLKRIKYSDLCKKKAKSYKRLFEMFEKNRLYPYKADYCSQRYYYWSKEYYKALEKEAIK